MAGTVGNKILTNTTGPQKIEIDKKTTLEVKCSVKSLSFSAHADAKVASSLAYANAHALVTRNNSIDTALGHYAVDQTGGA